MPFIVEFAASATGRVGFVRQINAHSDLDWITVFLKASPHKVENPVCFPYSDTHLRGVVAHVRDCHERLPVSSMNMDALFPDVLKHYGESKIVYHEDCAPNVSPLTYSWRDSDRRCAAEILSLSPN